MEVIAFIGPTGTGKSHRASKVAHDCGADVLIDDGILIKDNRIIAGSSAKYESNKIRSVKKAIFIDEEHAKEVREALLNNSGPYATLLAVAKASESFDLERISIAAEAANLQADKVNRALLAATAWASEVTDHWE